MLFLQNQLQQKELHANIIIVITILEFKNWLDKKKENSDNVVKTPEVVKLHYIVITEYIGMGIQFDYK